MISRSFFVLALIAFSSSAFADADPRLVQRLTEEISSYDKKWTDKESREMLIEADHIGHLTEVISTDKGIARIEIMGSTILINGKDITGNLGSKTTHGPNSPIIEDVRNSQVTTGDKSPITQKKSNYTINFSLSIALSLSVVLNLYLLQKQRRSSSRKEKRSVA
jgi:hypothetical protein